MPKRILLPKPQREPSAHHLSKFGYKLTHKKDSRHSSLKRASNKYGTLTVLKRLNLIRNLTNPELVSNKKKLSSDVKFMTEYYKNHHNMSRAGSKKGTKRNTKRNSKKGTKRSSKKGSKKTARK
jgi:hypothetical protein